MTVALRRKTVAEDVRRILKLYNGAFFDAQDLSTMFQDAAGTVPVTAMEQPVGLWLDKSQGLQLGPELQPSNNLSGFTSTQDSITYTDSSFTTTILAARGVSKNLLTVGKFYSVTVNMVSNTDVSINTADGLTPTVRTQLRVGSGSTTFKADMPYLYIRNSNPGTTTINSISVREIKGNHATQSVTASRPVVSARYNLLTKTEDFTDNTAWSKSSTTIVANAALSPINTLTADKVVLASGALSTGNDQAGSFGVISMASNGLPCTFTIYAAPAETPYLRIRETVNSGARVKINLTDGSFVGEAGWNSSIFQVSVTPSTNGFFRIVITRTAPVTFGFNLKSGMDVGDGVSGFYVWGADMRVGSTIDRYQRVNTATDYDTVGFKKYLKFDGVDDYLNLPYMGLYANGSASVVCGVARNRAGAVKYILAEGNTSSGKSYIPLRLSDTGITSRLINDAGTTVILTKEAPLPANSFPEIISFVDSGGRMTLSKNSEAKNSQLYTRVDPVTLNTLTLGAIAQTSVTENMSAGLYGLIITKSALSDADRRKCEVYLSRKAGVQL